MARHKAYNRARVHSVWFFSMAIQNAHVPAQTLTYHIRSSHRSKVRVLALANVVRLCPWRRMIRHDELAALVPAPVLRLRQKHTSFRRPSKLTR